MSGGGRVVAIAAMHRRSCDCDGGHDVAVARIRRAAYGGGSALVCEQHLRLVQGQDGVDVLPLEEAQP